MSSFLVKIMKSDDPGAAHGNKNAEPLVFAKRFLQLYGAAVEEDESSPGGTLEALLPENLSSLLNTPEYIQLAADGREDPAASGDADGRYTVSYGSQILDRMVSGALEKIPLVCCRLGFDYIKSGGFDRLLADQMAFYGAVATIETTADSKGAYALVTCRYTAQSDEQKEGLLFMSLNMQTGSLVPHMAELLESANCSTVFAEPSGGERSSLASLGQYIEQNAKLLLHDKLEPFRQAMNRRYMRDARNLEEYYQSLKNEMQNSLQNKTLSESARMDRQAKIDAIPDEFASKADDLFKKYSIRVRLVPTAAMVITSPVKKIACRLAVGKQFRQLFLTYNPVIKNFEPVPCAACTKAVYHIHFTTPGINPVCLECKNKK